MPILAYVISFGILCGWTGAAVFLYSIGEPEFNEDSPIANIKWVTEIRGAMYVFLFGLFWIVAFVICLEQFIIAALTCMWYFQGQKGNSDSDGEASLVRAMAWGIWYHCGSIAFGSFLIAVVSMVRVVFEYCQKQYDSCKGNSVIKVVSCCVTCMLWCLDKYVKFITKNAFI